MTITHRLPTLLAVGAASAAVGGCGGSGAGGASTDTPDDSKALAFAQCLRKAGIDAPDPKTGPGGKLSQMIRIPKGVSQARLGRITADCQRKTGGGPKPMSKQDQAKFRDAALKFAQCMRAQGVDIPDPQPGDGGIMIQKRSAGGVNPGSPAFQRAQKACATYLPGGRGGTVTQNGKGTGAGAALDSASGKP